MFASIVSVIFGWFGFVRKAEVWDVMCALYAEEHYHGETLRELEKTREESLDWNVRCQELTLEWRAECRESEALRERAQSLEVLATHAALLIREESWRHNDATLCDCCPLVVEVGECYPTCLTRHLLELSDIRETGRDPIETSDHLPF